MAHCRARTSRNIDGAPCRCLEWTALGAATYVWQYDKHFQALCERLDFIDDVNIRESLHRDRETGQLWRLCAVDGGGDMYPGTVSCFEPVTE